MLLVRKLKLRLTVGTRLLGFRRSMKMETDSFDWSVGVPIYYNIEQQWIAEWYMIRTRLLASVDGSL